MPIGSTISGQVGFTAETTPGTRVAPTKWVEVRSENLTAGRKTLRSNAIGGAGAILRPHVLLGQEPSGQIVTETAAETFGNWCRLMFGAPTTTGPVSTVYTHTFSWSFNTPLPTATIQVGRPDTGGTVRPFDYIGMMLTTWELAITPDEYVMLNTNFAGRRVDEAQTLGTPTWPTLTPWSSVHATLSLLGGTECFDQLTIRGDNKLNMDPVVCNTNPGERRVRQAGRPMLGGTFDQDFEDMTIYNAFKNGTIGDFSLVLNAAATAIVTITGRVQFVEDNSPSLSGPEAIVKQSCPFEFVRDGSNTDAQAFSVAVQTTVATV